MAHTHYYFESDTTKYDAFFKNRPHILYTGLVKDVKNWYSESNSHTFYELLFFYKGSGTIFTNGKSYNVDAGNIVIYHPGVVHREQASIENPFHFTFLAFEASKEFEKNCYIFPPREGEPVINSGEYHYHLENTFTQLLNEAQNQIDGYEVMCDSFLSSIIIQISRIYTANKEHSVSSNEALKVKKFIDNNFTKDLTLDTLSEIVYVSKYHLAHMFKDEIGVPPITYMINKRMDEAKHLLSDTNMTISEISSIIGYDNQNYFSQQFKKIVGKSPLHYRQATKK
ncbi:MAG: AraC family transcriptional regulator [Anaerolineaceae bacterium]|nr:MAG: AraC family transcriptional regulator [Anaerolineaceae bacterium]